MGFTRKDKNDLIRRIVQAKEKDELAALKKQTNEFCVRASRESLGLSDEILKQIPDGVLATATYFQFFDKNTLVLSCHLSDSIAVRGSYICCNTAYMPLTGELLAEAIKYAKRRAEMEWYLCELRDALRSVVYSVNSVKKLVAVWPEVAQIIEIDAADEKPLSLIPLVKTVNSLLDLRAK